MNTKQWNALGFTALVVMMLFVNLDLKQGNLFNNPCDYMESLYREQYDNGEITLEEYGAKRSRLADLPLDKYDVMCAINGEIYEPFIYLSFIVTLFSFICAGLERGKKQ